MNIAIVGATGNVGRKLIGKKNFEISELFLVASSKSEGKKLTLMEKNYSYWSWKIWFFKSKNCFFAAGSAIAEKWANIAAEKTIVIDN